ncbi:MAG TPA: hypothetical protein VD766_10725 [Solirubrobacterales bacterium]|nr:hypothetical protein [Solirubrobacterales bacterium]
MTISADQSAVLEMLLTGGQSYEDLDDLFGVSEGDTRDRARGGLEQMGGADPDRNVGLTDYLLGQADPIGRADAVRHLRQDAADRELAEKILSELETLFPAAELPKLPQAPAGSRFGGRASATPAQPAGEPRASGGGPSRLSGRQTRMIAGMGAAAVILIAVVLAVAGVFSGDEEGSTPNGDETASTPTDPAAPTDPSTPIPDGEEISRVPLAPPDGGKAGGAAVVGIASGSQPYLDLVLSNLPDAPKGQAYLAWFMFNETQGYPMTEPIVPQNGNFENRLAIPLEVAEPISRAVAIEISLSDPRDIVKSIQTAAEAGDFQIERPGQTVLFGEVPRAPAGGEEDQQAPGEGGGE